MRVYVLTEDQYEDNFGVEIVLMGVFTSLEKAQKAENESVTGNTKITETILDDLTDDYLGGYIE